MQELELPTIINYLWFYSVYLRNVRGRNLKNDTVSLWNPDRVQIFFVSPKKPDRPWGPPSLLFSWCRGSSLEVKRQGYEVDQSPLTRIEVKNEWSYTATPPTSLHGVNMGNFTFFNFILYGSVSHYL